MPSDVVEAVLVWEVWFTHSHCVFGECDAVGDPERSCERWLYDTWSEAAADIEKRITERPATCQLDTIIDRVSISKTEYEEVFA